MPDLARANHSGMSTPLRIGIVLSSTRAGRFADKPAAWLLDLARKREERDGVAFELVDLRDYPMPFFDEPKSPLREASTKPEVVKWSQKVAALDAFVFITSEYNHGITAALKNAIDSIYPEWIRKPAAFVGYGNAGGARAIEQLRLNLVEVQVAPLRSAVHIDRGPFIEMLMHGKSFADFPQLDTMAETMLDDVIWWGKALRSARSI